MVKLGAGQIVRERARSQWVQDFPDAAAVWRILTQTKSDDFGHVDTWSRRGSYGASYWTVTGIEAMALGQLDVAGTVTLIMPQDADVTERDQIIYTVAETQAVRHFEITMVHDRTRGQDLKVTCTEYKFTQPDMPT